MGEQNQIKSVFNNSANFANKLGSRLVETEHLLFGVLCAEDSIASKLLSSLGVTKENYGRVVKSIPQSISNSIGNSKVMLSKNVALIYNSVQDENANVQDVLWFLLSKKEFKSYVIISSVFGLDVNNILTKLQSSLGLNSKNK